MQQGSEPDDFPPNKEARNQHTPSASVEADETNDSEESRQWQRRDYTEEPRESPAYDEENPWDSAKR